MSSRLVALEATRSKCACALQAVMAPFREVLCWYVVLCVYPFVILPQCLPLSVTTATRFIRGFMTQEPHII